MLRPPIVLRLSADASRACPCPVLWYDRRRLMVMSSALAACLDWDMLLSISFFQRSRCERSKDHTLKGRRVVRSRGGAWFPQSHKEARQPRQGFITFDVDLDAAERHVAALAEMHLWTQRTHRTHIVDPSAIVGTVPASRRRTSTRR
jgi:hypothetical protein